MQFVMRPAHSACQTNLCLPVDLGMSLQEIICMFLLQLTCVGNAVQPGVPAMFDWLNTRLPSLELVNIAFLDDGSGATESLVDDDELPWSRSLPQPLAADGHAPLRAVRLVRGCHYAWFTCHADLWLAPLASYANLAALCLEGMHVEALPVLPQLRALIHRDSDFKKTLLESIARQPALESVSLECIWGGGKAVFQWQALSHLRHLRLDIERLSEVQAAMPDDCSVALSVCFSPYSDTWERRRPQVVPLVSQCAANLSSLTLVFPNLDWQSWGLSRFARLTALSITLNEPLPSDFHRLELSALLAALPGSVSNVEVECPALWEVVSPLTLPPTVTAFKLDIMHGRASGWKSAGCFPAPAHAAPAHAH